MKLLVVCALITVAAAAPGLLRVPKVYNAVITSNQNLSPSRAFPVIQPVIHRTAVGYVPPFYYTQIAPHFAGSQVTHYPPLPAAAKPLGKDLAQASSFASSTSRLVESTSFGTAKQREGNERGKGEDISKNGVPSKDAPGKHEQVPLSFYPSYHSFYYEPYIYTYNGFNPHLVPPATYYIDYQPYGTPEPIPPVTTPKNAASGHLLPSFHDEKTVRAKQQKEKIPDVPPPPLPSSVPKRS